MRRILSFVDERRGVELVLPVTPPSYAWSYGSAVETLALDQLGDLNLRGSRKLAQQTIELLLPAQAYPFCNPGAVTNPWYYIDQLKIWSDSETPIRYLVSGTPINVSVLIEELSYSEKDGSGDLYASISLKEYQRLDTPTLSAQGKQEIPQRPAESGAATVRSYTVQKGDTLSGISKKFYGNASFYPRIAAANGMKNPNLIYPGRTITIPPLDHLPGAGSSPPSVILAKSTNYDPKSGTWR